MLIHHPSMHTHSCACRWTLSLVSQTQVLFQSATPVSSRQDVLPSWRRHRPPLEGVCSTTHLLSGPGGKDGDAMWRERMSAVTSFLKPTHVLRSVLEGCQHALVWCLFLVWQRSISSPFLAKFPVSFLDLPSQAVNPSSATTTMRNLNIKSLLEAICPRQVLGPVHGPTGAMMCVCWVRCSLIRNIFKPNCCLNVPCDCPVWCVAC